MANTNDLQRIYLDIAGYTVELKVVRDEEPIYRDAAKLLNETYQRYYSKYPQLSPERLWMYAALEIASIYQRDEHTKNLQPVLDKITEINNELTQFLTNN